MGIRALKFNPLASEKGQLAVGTDGFETLLTNIVNPVDRSPRPSLRPRFSFAMVNNSTAMGQGGQAQVSFRSTQAAKLKVGVYDVRGHRVSVLADRVFPAGENRVIWDGRDSRGLTCASGMYFVRVTNGEQAITGKVLLTR